MSDLGQAEARLKEAQETAEQCRAEASSYARLLNECREVMDQAQMAGDWTAISRISSRIAGLLNDDGHRREIGAIHRGERTGEASWLARTIQSLQRIGSKAARLEVEERSPNALLKEDILDAVEEGLGPQV